MTELQATREYKLHLERSLERAKERLAPNDFDTMVVGVRREIKRLEAEIDGLHMKSFMGCTDTTPLVPRILEFVTKAASVWETNEYPTYGFNQVGTMLAFPGVHVAKGDQIVIDNVASSIRMDCFVNI